MRHEAFFGWLRQQFGTDTKAAARYLLRDCWTWPASNPIWEMLFATGEGPYTLDAWEIVACQILLPQRETA